MDGGYVKPANLKEDRKDRRFCSQPERQAQGGGYRRERNGNSVPAVSNPESQAASFIRARIAKGTTVHVDEASAWDHLHERFEVEASTIKRRIASKALAPIGLRSISAASVARRSASITISLARTCFDMLRRPHGGRTTAASRTANRWRALLHLR